MKLTDRNGLEMTAPDNDAVEKYDAIVHQIHGYMGDPVSALENLVREYPELVMAHCLLGALYVVAAEKAVVPLLKETVGTLESLSTLANDRERRHTAAIKAWLDGDFKRCSDIYGAIVTDYPRDTVAIQFSHLLDFYLGQSRMLRDRIAQVLPHWSEQDAAYGYLLGMYAFGLEENNEFALAETQGRRATEMNPEDAWAVHAVAHVMEMQGRLDDGIHWLSKTNKHWSYDNTFAFHNWWHLSLFHLDKGNIDRVLNIYDNRIFPQPTDIALEWVDATALLWRLHLMGVDTGERWKVLNAKWSSTLDDGFYAFNDVHAMMSFVATDNQHAISDLLNTVQRAAEINNTNGMMSRDVGLPVCRGIQAFSRGDYTSAVEFMLPVRDIANRFGGSNAQRDIIDRTIIEAALRGKQGKLATALISERMLRKPENPFNWRLIRRSAEILQEQGNSAPVLFNLDSGPQWQAAG